MKHISNVTKYCILYCFRNIFFYFIETAGCSFWRRNKKRGQVGRELTEMFNRTVGYDVTLGCTFTEVPTTNVSYLIRRLLLGDN